MRNKLLPFVMSKAFNERLKELRKAAGLTQQQLAQACGISISGVQKLEYGGIDPSWSTVQRLAGALGIGVEKLADGQSSKKKRGQKGD